MTIFGLFGLFGPFWAFLGFFGPFWAFLGLFGPFWAFFGLFWPIFEIRAGCSTERVFRFGRRANSRENNGLFWGQKGPKNAFFENRFFPYYLPVDLCVFRG